MAGKMPTLQDLQYISPYLIYLQSAVYVKNKKSWFCQDTRNTDILATLK